MRRAELEEDVRPEATLPSSASARAIPASALGPTYGGDGVAQLPAGVIPPADHISARPLAEPWKRIAALLIDNVILILSNAAIAGTVRSSWFDLFTSYHRFTYLLVVGVLFSLVGFFYKGLMIFLTGRTVGGMAVSVAGVDESGRPVTREQAFKRGAYYWFHAVPYLGVLAMAALLIWGLVSLFTNPRRQTPWDKFAATLVVDSPHAIVGSTE